MDKNNCNNNSYFYERNYYKDVPSTDTKMLEYWNNILGKDVIESIDKAYGVSIEQILFSEYSLNHKYISFATLNQEYSDMCNEKAISYLTKKGTKVLFDQFVLRFLGYGKRVLERKSRKGYIVKVIQDCFLKNLAERILDVSLSTLIFEMYLAKEQGELRGNDEAEEYKDYNQRFLGNDKYIKELFSIYPGLKSSVLNREGKEKLKQKCKKLMEKVGIADLAGRDISTLSGGQAQRVSICRSIMNDPKIIFADEPTGALNSKTSDEVMDLFVGMNKEGSTIMLVTHDSKVAAKARQVWFLLDGHISKKVILGNWNQKSDSLQERQLMVNDIITKLKV